ncbi:MAG: hypothetical protein BIFFINMI_03655 [Phycisphaerae bacterium]|nr:hypothetical protein [Phycisphaerae bacterium]
MNRHPGFIAALSLVLMLPAARSWADPSAPADAKPLPGTTYDLSAESLTGLGLQAMDKPNDNGTGIMLTWPRQGWEAPNALYQVLMGDDLAERLDALVDLKVIDAARRDELLGQLGAGPGQKRLFWVQETLASERPKEGSAVAPPMPLRSDYPAVFGFKKENDGYHAIEMIKFKRDDLVLHIDRETNDETRKLVKEVEARGLVNQIVPLGEGETTKVDLKQFSDAPKHDRTYYFALQRVEAGVVTGRSEIASAVPKDNWFAWHKLNLLIAMFVLGIIIMAFAWIARRNPTGLFIRRIGGLEAVDEALGRAAEMGKPVFFCHGPGDLSAVVTISAINLLGKIAERVGEYGIRMKVTCLDYLVMQVSQEMVRDAYTRVGRPDAYNDDDVFFVTGDTFAYSAAVSGMMMREKAGTAFFFGRFGSESLLLSETGAVTKAIQIAGTDSFNQIPFFITTCDYTLIAEEMYAASAYLSREPRLVGAVKGQDVVKAIMMTIIVVGAVLVTFGFMGFAHLFWPLTN